MATRKATPEELEELQKSMMAWGIGAHRPRPAPDDSADKSAKTEEKAKPRVCNFLWAARSRLIDVGGDSVTK